MSCQAKGRYPKYKKNHRQKRREKNTLLCITKLRTHHTHTKFEITTGHEIFGTERVWSLFFAFLFAKTSSKNWDFNNGVRLSLWIFSPQVQTSRNNISSVRVQRKTTTINKKKNDASDKILYRMNKISYTFVAILLKCRYRVKHVFF